MIPLFQNDYYKYSQMFKGNYKKGATLFKSLLDNPDIQYDIIESVPAMAAVFTDFSNSEAERLCYDILAEKGLLEDATMEYLKGLGMTSYSSFSTLRNNSSQIINIFRDSSLDPILQNNPKAMQTILKKKTICKALAQGSNSDIFFREDKLKTLSEVMPYTEENLYTSFTTYWNTIRGTVTPFVSTEEYYSYSAAYEWAIVSEKNSYVFLPVSLETKLSSSSTYYYYPAVFCYNISTKTWKFIYAASSSVKQTNNKYNSRNANGLAYDETNNRLYIFYKPSYTSAEIRCDIIYGTTGSTYRTGISVSSVGSSSEGEPFFCTYDASSSCAKYAWKVGSETASKTDSNGWLYGASVNSSGSVSWVGKALHPAYHYGSYYTTSAFNATKRAGLRNTKYAICCVIGETNTTPTPCLLGCLESYGSAFRVKFIHLFNSSPGYLISPNAYALSKGGLALLTYESTYYNSTSRQAAYAAIDVSNNLCEVSGSAGGTFTAFQAPYFDKVAIKNSSSNTKYILYGFNGKSNAGTISSMELDELPALFKSSGFQERGSERYKLKFSSSTIWTLTDFEGGLI